MGVEQQQHPPPPTCTSHFLSEALVWMASASSDLEGKLNCPGCSSRVGALSWVVFSPFNSLVYFFHFKIAFGYEQLVALPFVL